MRLSIEQFRERFDFSERAIQGLKESHYNQAKGYYNTFTIDVYRGEGCLDFKGRWVIDFNRGYCWLANEQY